MSDNPKDDGEVPRICPACGEVTPDFMILTRMHRGDCTFGAPAAELSTSQLIDQLREHAALLDSETRGDRAAYDTSGILHEAAGEIERLAEEIAQLWNLVNAIRDATGSWLGFKPSLSDIRRELVGDIKDLQTAWIVKPEGGLQRRSTCCETPAVVHGPIVTGPDFHLRVFCLNCNTAYYDSGDGQHVE